MSEHAPDRLWSGIDIPKTIAGVLAAVTAAVIGSFLGAAGTLAGAAIASVVGSVGTEIYRKLVHRGQQKIVATFVTAPAAVGTPAVAAASDESPSQPEPVADDRPTAVTAPRQMRWGRVAMVAASVFVLAIGVLTAFELITGKTAADAVTGGHSGASSTVGGLIDRKSDNKDVTPVTTPSSATPSATPSTSGSEAPAGSSSSPATAASDSTPSSPSATSDATSPEPASTDTQNSDGGDSGQNDQTNQNNIAPPPSPQPQGTE
jgi:hypothetical protein